MSRPCLRPGGLRLTERALSVCGLPRGARVVDAGCGPGATADYLEERHGMSVTGLDPSPESAAWWRMRAAVGSFVRAKVEDMPFAGDSFDGALCECVLSLLADPARAMAELARVLRPGGSLIVSDLYRRLPADPVSGGAEPDGPPTGPRAIREIGRDLVAAGFRPILLEDYTDSLREMAAQLVLAGDGMVGYAERFGPGVGGRACGALVSGMKPGYYLLVCRRV